VRYEKMIRAKPQTMRSVADRMLVDVIVNYRSI
jgi:hypothetical protein